MLAEVDAFGRDRVPTGDDLEARFPFTRAAIQEALRLFPPAALAIRDPPAGGMELGGVWVPADAKLQVGPWPGEAFPWVGSVTTASWG